MKLKINTLTPIHIGTGRELMPEFDFVSFGDSVSVLDEVKVLAVFAGGQAPNAEDITRWVSIIDKGENLIDYLRKRKPNLNAADIGRVIPLSGANNAAGNIKSIRAQMHGCGLVPGSSLKGAIRTALLAYFIDQDGGRTVKNTYNLFDRRNQFNASNLEKKFFGPSPHQDIMRLLQVGEAHFDKTEVLKTEVLNLRGDDWKRKNSLEVWVEAIPAGQTAASRLKFDKDFRRQKFLGDRDRDLLKSLEPVRLFEIINEHTLRLVESEIKFWLEDEGNPTELGDYCESLERIRKEIKNCDSSACVLRCGWASGWKSMTGGWQKHLSDEIYDKLVLAIRPRHPVGLPYPKTTRFQSSGEPLGFLKLTIQPE